MGQCGQWWIPHVAHTYGYVMGLYQRNKAAQDVAVEYLVQGAVDWGKLLGLPQAGDLMKVHVLGAKGVADGAFGGDSGLVDRSVNSLLSNLEDQTNLYTAQIPNFKANEFHDLFAMHITATGAYITALAQHDHPEFGRQFSIVQENRDQMMGFWNVTCRP